MAKFKAKAEQMFETKVQHYMSRNDWKSVEEVTRQFEAYLKLVEPMCTYRIEDSIPFGEVELCDVHNNNSKHDSDDPHRPCLTIDPYTKEVEARPAEEPTVIEEQEYILSGEFEKVNNANPFGKVRRYGWPVKDSRTKR